jgi:hypothetical protein
MIILRFLYGDVGGSRCQLSVMLTTPFFRERANKRKLTEVVVDFALICRGLINTEYGRQTAAQLIEES